jgi:hypothetical protein
MPAPFRSDQPPARLPAALGFAGLLLVGAAVLPSFGQAPGSPYDNPPPDNTRPSEPGDPFPFPPELIGVELLKQTDGQKQAKSAGCVTCHQSCADPHFKPTVKLGCTDCHGGNANCQDLQGAHVRPRFPDAWPGSANPVRSYTLLNHESPEFVRFVNPGDLRVAHISCGTVGCHPREVQQNRKSIMTTGAMLWGAALYNNGSVPYKRARHGESYAMTGAPLRLQTVPPPTEEEYWRRGVVPFLDPLPRFENSQPGNILRVFERGGRFRPETGIPEREEDPGKPRTRLSDRGLGTENRTDPVFLSLNKTRLLDPMLSFLGTNDHPGDYRSSGCSACHVLYANDRSPVHSAQYHAFGNRGTSAQPDPTIPRDRPGHPIEHRFRTGIPSSQCMVCHVHPGTSVMNSYFGYTWWDEETEGRLMYPPAGKRRSPEQVVRDKMFNPDEVAGRGNWTDPEFLADLAPNLNPLMDKAQFADFHGHGWVFRAVYRHDRAGRLLDVAGRPVRDVTPEKLAAALRVPLVEKEIYKAFDPSKKPAGYEVRELLAAEEKLIRERAQANLPVHLLDVHLQKGMHCVDCHFVQDVHGNGRLHQEVRAAVEVQCVDCHGTIADYATLRTSGPASYTSDPDPTKGRDLAAMRTPFGRKRFERLGERVFQNSMVEPGLRWEVTQTKDVITPGHPRYNAKAHLAKTVRVEGNDIRWGGDPTECQRDAAHSAAMTCQSCHSSWNPSCYGCHLPQQANLKMPNLHWEGDVSRNYVNYNFQTLRDDVFMLARDGDATGNRVSPARSSCAIHVGSYNANRESIYVQQQTISGEGFSGVAFSTNVPHTVGGRGTTKTCTDCHVSPQNDNNAWMAQLLMHGTNVMNFIGRYCWVAAGAHGLEGVVVTERGEPQAVLGSSLHALAYPEEFTEFVGRGRRLEHAHEHPGRDVGEGLLHPLRETEVLSVQARGEYLLAACGEGGLRAFDIAFIDDKGFSERITSAPVSPAGQRFHVPTKYATAVAAPVTTAPDPTRTHRPENREQPVHPLYGYVYVADKCEGLILVGVATMIDGNPLNNFLKRELTFNPDGLLTGARNVTIVGTYAYVCCDAGLVVVSIDDPKQPAVTAVVGPEYLRGPRAVQVQFRYAYVCDEDGIKVLDVTCLERPVPVALLRLPEAHSVYLARTYAYVAAGRMGLVILDITVPDRPRVDQVFDAGGCINDLRDVKLGITYNSQFAYLADGKNGLRVVQLTSPETPGNDGFSPRPTPVLIATRHLPHGGKALAVSKGLDRDRAVDESGNQLSVFGRVGARPLNAAEQRRLYLRPDGGLWQFGDDPEDAYYRARYLGPPRPPAPLAGP